MIQFVGRVSKFTDCSINFSKGRNFFILSNYFARQLIVLLPPGRLILLFSICLLLLFAHHTPASQIQYGLKSWTVDDGLPQNSVYAIHQTRDGYLWMATLDGLTRFDGVRFTIYNKVNTPGLTTNLFISLYEARDGDLWIGTVNGDVTRYHEGTFTTYTSQHGLSGSPAWGITGDEEGNIWLLSGSQLLRWDNGMFLHVESNNLELSFNLVQRNGRGGFWGKNVDGSLILFSHGRLSIISLPGIPAPSPSTRAAVAEDAQGTVWVASSAGLISIRDGKLVKLYTLADGLPSYNLYFISGPELKIACFDRNNDLLILSQNTPDAQGQWVARSIIRKPPDSLGRLFYGLYEDREGNLWFATYKNGIFRAQQQAIKVYAKEDGLLDTNIYPLYEDRTGAMWVGAWPASISRFGNNTWTNYSLKMPMSTGQVTAFHEDRQGNLWAALYSTLFNGLLRFQNRHFTPARDLPKFEAGVISAIHQDRDGALWFGGEWKLIRYRNGAVNAFTIQDGLAGNFVKAIIDDAAGGLWIGTDGGLSQWRDGHFTNYTESQGLPSNNVWALYQDSDGVLWIGTYDGGLGRLQNGHFTRYTTRQGLFDNGVFQILEDTQGYFWMSSNHGIYRVSRQELNEFAEGRRNTITSVAFGSDDGLINITCNGGRSPAGIKARDGRLWFPTQDGVAVIDPEALPINQQPPPVVIEAVKLDRDLVAFNRSVEIAPQQKDLEVEYTALSFINSEHLQFRYKLEGLNQDWIDAGTRRTAYYSHLPPGEYFFRVIAANRDGVWNEQGQSLRIIVLPPFYRTWWFLTLVALTVAGVIWSGYQYRITRLKRAQAMQQAFSRQLIASQEAERQRIAAELHDGLNQSLVIIKNRATLSLSDTTNTTRAFEQLEEIADAATHAIDESKEIAYNLRPFQLDRLGLTQAIESMVKNVSNANNINIVAEIEPIDGLIPKESEINFYRVVQESLNNIVKHAQATEARVTVRREGSAISLTITDNGAGFTVGAVNTSTKRGFGLIGLEERAKILGGALSLHSTPGEGTTVRMRIAVRDKKQ
jgi:signal transduction histidine kinase/streptogramin lyase